MRALAVYVNGRRVARLKGRRLRRRNYVKLPRLNPMIVRVAAKTRSGQGGGHTQGLSPLRRAPVEGAAGRGAGPGLAGVHDLRCAVLPALIRAAAALCALALPAAAIAANDPLRPDQPNLSLVESDGARPNGSTGKGAIVAMIDTGVKRSHPDLQGGRLLAGYDFVDNDGDPQDEVDGHGTHVLGIVGAAEGNGVGVSSVAPGAQAAAGARARQRRLGRSSPTWRRESTTRWRRART